MRLDAEPCDVADFIGNRLDEIERDDSANSDIEFGILAAYIDYRLKRFGKKKDSAENAEAVVSVCRAHGFVPQYRLSTTEAIEPDRIIASTCQRIMFLPDFSERHVSILNTSYMRILTTVPFSPHGYLASSEDGHYIAFQSDGALHVMRTSDLRIVLSMGAKSVRGICWSRGGLTAVGADGRTSVYDSESGTDVLAMQTGMRPLAFDPDGMRLLAIHRGGAAIVELASGHVHRTDLFLSEDSYAIPHDGCVTVLSGQCVYRIDFSGAYELLNVHESISIPPTIGNQWPNIVLDGTLLKQNGPPFTEFLMTLDGRIVYIGYVRTEDMDRKDAHRLRIAENRPMPYGPVLDSEPQLIRTTKHRELPYPYVDVGNGLMAGILGSEVLVLNSDNSRLEASAAIGADGAWFPVSCGDRRFSLFSTRRGEHSVEVHLATVGLTGEMSVKDFGPVCSFDSGAAAPGSQPERDYAKHVATHGDVVMVCDRSGRMRLLKYRIRKSGLTDTQDSMEPSTDEVKLTFSAVDADRYLALSNSRNPDDEDRSRITNGRVVARLMESHSGRSFKDLAPVTLNPNTATMINGYVTSDKDAVVFGMVVIREKQGRKTKSPCVFSMIDSSVFPPKEVVEGILMGIDNGTVMVAKTLPGVHIFDCGEQQVIGYAENMARRMGPLPMELCFSRSDAGHISGFTIRSDDFDHRTSIHNILQNGDCVFTVGIGEPAGTGDTVLADTRFGNDATCRMELTLSTVEWGRLVRPRITSFDSNAADIHDGVYAVSDGSSYAVATLRNGPNGAFSCYLRLVSHEGEEEFEIQCPSMDTMRPFRPVCAGDGTFCYVSADGILTLRGAHSRESAIPEEIGDVVPIYADENRVLLMDTECNLFASDWSVIKPAGPSPNGEIDVSRKTHCEEYSIFYLNGREVVFDMDSIRYSSGIILKSGELVGDYGVYRLDTR